LDIGMLCTTIEEKVFNGIRILILFEDRLVCGV